MSCVLFLLIRLSMEVVRVLDQSLSSFLLDLSFWTFDSDAASAICTCPRPGKKLQCA